MNDDCYKNRENERGDIILNRLEKPRMACAGLTYVINTYYNRYVERLAQ